MSSGITGSLIQGMFVSQTARRRSCEEAPLLTVRGNLLPEVSLDTLPPHVPSN
jgi:hypothetical protein